MFFRETREKEEDIKRMFCEAREKMRKRVTLKKKSDHGQFAIQCTVKGIEFPHALPKPKPSENPPDTVRIPSDDGEDSMEVDRVLMGRTLRKRKKKLEKHLKRGPMIRKRKVSEKESSIFL
ncbi:hypothetical protein F2Q70_00029837 [Brassica cretica]|uniref:Uncharacterized protein n=1 Tax=Brassica cretica TaxID=69181 RepID=A0A8S9FKF9_BRACR|nr:hypothetical protein F2Q70_00029837 [Brassica cretica]